MIQRFMEILWGEVRTGYGEGLHPACALAVKIATISALSVGCRTGRNAVQFTAQFTAPRVDAVAAHSGA
jgi:hypothetical protein